jgi:hypothetical protein
MLTAHPEPRHFMSDNLRLSNIMRLALFHCQAIFPTKELYAKAFTRPREPRSDEYKAGIRAGLLYRRGLDVRSNALIWWSRSRPMLFISGLDEGHRIFREYEVEKKGPSELRVRKIALEKILGR